MSGTVDVLVRVFDKGANRQEIVPVEAECFDAGRECWRVIASIKAAVIMELPFTWVLDHARFGLRPEDRERLAAELNTGQKNTEGPPPPL